MDRTHAQAHFSFYDSLIITLLSSTPFIHPSITAIYRTFAPLSNYVSVPLFSFAEPVSGLHFQAALNQLHHHLERYFSFISAVSIFSDSLSGCRWAFRLSASVLRFSLCFFLKL